MNRQAWNAHLTHMQALGALMAVEAVQRTDENSGQRVALLKSLERLLQRIEDTRI